MCMCAAGTAPTPAQCRLVLDRVVGVGFSEWEGWEGWQNGGRILGRADGARGRSGAQVDAMAGSTASVGIHSLRW
jgi:hypothetical protein